MRDGDYMSSDDNKIYLTRDEFARVLALEVGHGTDGVVFKYNKDYLIKIYRKDFLKYPDELLDGPKDDSDMKTYDPMNKPKFVPIRQNIEFTIKEGDTQLRLAEEEAIKETIKKQKRITKTRLPQKLVYVDGKFVGVLLKTVHGIQVHKLTGAPLSYKKKVMHAILDAVEELLTNNVYHTDLDNSPYATVSYSSSDKTVKSYGHSHVLLNPFTLKVNIIDLDGKSATYTDYYDEQLEKMSLQSLTRLMFEFLYGVEPLERNENAYGHDIDMEFELEQKGIPEEDVGRLATEGVNSIEEARDLVDRAR